ncbi:MAG: hypothetical protein ACLR02_02390 [Clostridium sp.]|jgi:hypothetical protein|nr:hypothetical protein [Clostridium sp.]
MSNNNSNGVGFIGLLQLVFIILKLTKVISWSWVWVLSPIWIELLIFTIALFIYVLGHWD